MKETDFIKQNKKKWARFEKLSSNKSNDPDEVSELFTEITEDLSYARTFYPRRSVRVYLNQLSQGVFTSLYRQRKQPIGNFIKFWKETVPLEVYRARRNMLAAFLFFVLAVIVGVVSQHYDGNFASIILGDHYIAITEENIANNNPLGIYGDSPGGSMFFQITVNNIRVAFYAFVGGILFTLGTYWVMLQNGIMLGAFQWWFKGKGLLFASFLGIWIHGAFEISAIVIAGAAGLTVGNGIIFPKSYSRVQSLVFAAKRGLVIMLSLIPFFIMAGALESFVTRWYKEIPVIIKMLIIFGSFGIIIFYYVIYPFMVAKNHPDKIEVKEVPRFIPKRKINWFKIRKPGEIFTDTFTLLISNMSRLSRIFFNVIAPFIIALVSVIFYIEHQRFNYTMIWYQTFGTLFGTGNDFQFYKLFGWCVPFAMLIAAAYFVIIDKREDNLLRNYLKFMVKHFIWLYLYALLIYSIFLFSPGVLLLFVILVAPFLNAIPSIIIHEKKDFFTAFSRSFDLGKGGYGDSLVSFLALVAITVIFFFILHNPIAGLMMIIDDFLRQTLITVVDGYSIVIAVVHVAIYMLYFFMMFSICMISFSLNHHSVLERKTAKGLYERLEKFGKRNRSYETELDFD